MRVNRAGGQVKKPAQSGTIITGRALSPGFRLDPRPLKQGNMNMDAITDKALLRAPAELVRPSMEEAMDAVRTLLRWAGDDPAREGLIDTPKRVAKAYREFFAGYEMDPVAELSRTFEDVQGYDDIVMLRDIDVESHCEHHMVPILGKAHVAYMPTNRVVGISKIARVVEIFGKRLQTQETMTAQVADCITEALRPAGVAVLIDAKHQCMTTRGVHHKNVATITTQFTGVFKTDRELKDRFLRLAGYN
jgi:GTP cyclohydrolase I